MSLSIPGTANVTSSMTRVTPQAHTTTRASTDERIRCRPRVADQGCPDVSPLPEATTPPPELALPGTFGPRAKKRAIGAAQRSARSTRSGLREMSTLLATAKARYSVTPRWVTNPIGISSTMTTRRAVRTPARERFRRAVRSSGSIRAALARTREPSRRLPEARERPRDCSSPRYCSHRARAPADRRRSPSPSSSRESRPYSPSPTWQRCWRGANRLLDFGVRLRMAVGERKRLGEDEMAVGI